MELNKAITEYFNKKGKDLVGKLKDILRKKKKVASGKTLDSIDYSISINNEAQTLTISASEDLAYIIGGRKSGQLPPIEPIQDWVKAKGLKKSSAWAIAEDLKKNPVKGVSLKSFTKKEDQQIFEDLQELITGIEEENILNDLTNELKKSGVTIQ